MPNKFRNLLTALLLIATPSLHGFPSKWAVRTSGEDEARQIAASANADFKGQIGALDGFFLLDFAPSGLGKEAVARLLDEHPNVIWSEFQKALPTPSTTEFKGNPLGNPLFGNAWHLHNRGQRNSVGGEDINVIPAWGIGINGVGVMVGIIDTGMQMDHPDLGSNTRFDLAGDFLAIGSLTNMPEDETHGTSVAGVVAAADNNSGIVGVAYGAHLVPIRFIGGSTTYDASYANVLNHQLRNISIYNNSWGPSNSTGSSVAMIAPSGLAKAAIEKGTIDGRGGLGAIYVFSAGNDAEAGSEVNFNGWANMRHTIAVGAIGNHGIRSRYSEAGSALMLVAPSSGGRSGITTTTRTSSGSYTDDFGGTSASAPMVSGTVALMLQANPALTWRDVQHILIKSSVRVDPDHPDWVQNGVGRYVSHAYGFGKLDAGAAVAMAMGWKGSGAEQSLTSVQSGARSIPNATGEALTTKANVTTDLQVEHVEVTIQLDHSAWGDLEIKLISPQGTTSFLAKPHNSALNNYGSWTYSTLRNWGESSLGEWTLEIRDTKPQTSGDLIRWTLKVYGSNTDPRANRSPVARDDRYTAKDFPARIPVLANDSDPDGDAIILFSFYAPKHGEVRLVDNQQVLYTPGPGFLGEDRFGYTITDSKGGTSHAIVRIIDPRPVAVHDRVVAPMNGAVDINVLANDFDRSGDPIRLIAIGQPAFGHTALSTPTTVFYQPNAGFRGRDAFEYVITDDVDGESTGLVTVFTSSHGEHALLFNGQDNLVRVPPSPNLNLNGAFTLQSRFWLRSFGEADSVGFGRILDKENVSLFTNGNGHQYYPDGCLVVAVSHPDGLLGTINSPAGSIQVNRWHEVAVTYDGISQVRMWIDGRETPVESNIQAIRGAPADNAHTPLIFGESGNGNRAFDGLIDLVRIWNAVRTPTQILNYPGPIVNRADSLNLVGAWEFFEGSKEVAHDLSPMAHHGFLIGPIWAPKDADFLPEVVSW